MEEDLAGRMKRSIGRVPDFPRPGIIFRDVTTLWKNPALMKTTVDAIYEHYRGRRIDKVVGIEARGFVFGALLAERFGVGFIPARKLGKLPGESVREEYQLEYRTDGLEMRKDSVSPGDQVLIVDDLMATAGTALATTRMVERLGGRVVGLAFVIELAFLGGREKLAGYEIFSVVKYASEDE